MLRLDNIVKTYVSGGDETVHALRGVSIAFRESEFTSILGPSGCGKTTMLNIIGGLDRYDSGDLYINGRSTKEFVNADWDAYRNHNIGFIFQSYHLIPHLNVLENVELALTLSGVPKKERRERAKVALEKVGLKDQLKKMPNQMSGGQMQRVSIARALVNDPDIILADEPTGALDTNTSVQIMDLLAEISKTKLVIMVTHNPELAKRYSTRIVSLLDGEVVGDTNPYTPEEAPIDEKEERIPEEEMPAKKQRPSVKFFKKPRKVRKLGKKVKEGERTYMPFFTALTLSFRNLLTKKARTILIAIAGSIGIIGVGLVFAVQNGFDAYVTDMEQSSLVGVPIMVSPITYNPDGVQAMVEDYMPSSSDSQQQQQEQPPADTEKNQAKTFTSEDKVDIKLEQAPGTEESGSKTTGGDIAAQFINGALSSVQNLIAENVLSDNFVDYCNTEIMQTGYGTVQCTYDYKMRLASKKTGSSDAYWLDSSHVSMSELVDINGYVKKNYDLIGSMPKNMEEVVIILDKHNRVSSNVIDAIGLDHTNSDLLIKDLITGDNCPLKLVSNDAYYTLVEDGSISKYVAITNQDVINANYANTKLATSLKVVGVLRVKADASNDLLSSGIGVMPSLWEYAFSQAEKSEIVQAQKANTKIDVTTGKNLGSTNSKDDISGLAMSFLQMDKENSYYESALRAIGGSHNPILILIYVDSFSNKNKVKEALDAYNTEALARREADCASYVSRAIEAYAQKYNAEPGKWKAKTQEEMTAEYTEEFNKANKGKYEIIYTDVAEMTTDTIGGMIDMISIVLACFAGISLVVSSLMIGIITYISVVERTKEIGILRSIGARKIDISTVFNAETIIIGTAAGLIGIFMTYILSIPINLIIRHFANLDADIASLSPLYALGLVALSIFLTLIAGLFPAKVAATRDPVVALRTE